MNNKDIHTICKLCGANSLFELPKDLTGIMISYHYIERIKSKIADIDTYLNLLNEIGKIDEEFLSVESVIGHVDQSGIDLTYGLKEYFEAYIKHITEKISMSNNTYWKVPESTYGEDYYFEKVVYVPNDVDLYASSLHKLVKTHVTNAFLKTPYYENYRKDHRSDMSVVIFSDLSYTGAFSNYTTRGIPMAIIAIAPNDLAKKYLTYIKDNLESAYIKELDDLDKKYNELKKVDDAGGNAGSWGSYSKSTELNYNWIKTSQVTSNEYDMQALMSKKYVPFKLTFKSVDDIELKVSGTVKVVPVYGNPENGFSASIKFDDNTDTMSITNSNGIYKNILAFNSKNSIKFKILEKIKIYFSQVASKEYENNEASK